MPVLDLSRPIRPGMPAYPGAPDVRFDPVADYDPDGYREREFACVSHTGTHLDAPAHMVPGAKTLDQFPVDHFIGPACVLDVTDLPPGAVIERDRLDGIEAALKSSAFLLVRTGFAAKWGTDAYFDGIPVFAPEAAGALAGLSESAGGRLRGVGLDVISVDPVGADAVPDPPRPPRRRFSDRRKPRRPRPPAGIGRRVLRRPAAAGRRRRGPLPGMGAVVNSSIAAKEPAAGFPLTAGREAVRYMSSSPRQ